MNLEFNRKRQMEQGEELLGSSYSPVQIKGKGKVILGIDGGSTQTRVTIFPEDGDLSKLDDQFVIPSSHSEITGHEQILSQSEALFDNLDSWISCPDLDKDIPFERIRVLRGTKALDANSGEARINSTVQKIDTKGFYLNVIDSIAYALLMTNKEVNEEYDVYLGITLPPDNVTSEFNIDKFRNKIQRQFEWVNKNLGLKIKINVKAVTVQSEPEAVRKGQVTRDEIEDPGTTLIIECGGSTVGTAILKGFTVINLASQTFNYGGTQLQDYLSTNYKNKFGGGNISRESLKHALEHGTMRVKGKGVADVSELCVASKDQMAEEIYQDILTNVFDRISSKGISIEDMDNVIFSGRMVRPGSYYDDGTGYSIATKLSALLSESIPDAEFFTLDRNLIPYGNAIVAYMKYGSVLQEEEDADTATLEEEYN